MDIKERVPNSTALPRTTSTEQSVSIQEQQIVNEQTSNFDVSEKTHALAKDTYEECDLLSKKSLERVSPPKFEDKVIITLANTKYIFDESLGFFLLSFSIFIKKIGY